MTHLPSRKHRFQSPFDMDAVAGQLGVTVGTSAPVTARTNVNPYGDQQRVEHLLVNGHALVYELPSNFRPLHGTSSSPLAPKKSGQNTAYTGQAPGKPQASKAA